VVPLKILNLNKKNRHWWSRRKKKMHGPKIVIAADLVLRAPHLNESETFVKWFQDSEVTRYLGTDFQGLGVKEQKDFFRQRKEDQRTYFWLIAKLGTNKAIGSVELKLGKPENKTACLGIVIADKSYWNKGCGRQVIMALIDFAFIKLEVNRLELFCASVNELALNCYRKCGFVEEGRKRQAFFIDGIFCDEILMSIISKDLRFISDQRKD
jgi:RimJ/RimL family protein N-acetyltransferase